LKAAEPTRYSDTSADERRPPEGLVRRAATLLPVRKLVILALLVALGALAAKKLRAS